MHRVCSVLSMLFALAGIATCGVRGRPLSVPLAAEFTPAAITVDAFPAGINPAARLVVTRGCYLGASDSPLWSDD